MNLEKTSSEKEKGFSFPIPSLLPFWPLAQAGLLHLLVSRRAHGCVCAPLGWPSSPRLAQLHSTKPLSLFVPLVDRSGAPTNDVFYLPPNLEELDLFRVIVVSELLG